MMAALFAVLTAFPNPLKAATLPGKVSKAAAQRSEQQNGKTASMVNVNLNMIVMRFGKGVLISQTNSSRQI